MKRNNKIIIIVFVFLVLFVGFLIIKNIYFDDDVIDNSYRNDDVQFLSAELDTVNSSAYMDAEANIHLDGTTINLSLALKKPGDIIIYNITLVNDGEDTVILSNEEEILSVTGSSSILDNIEYSFKYADDTELNKGDKLFANAGTTYLKLIVKYKDDGVIVDDNIVNINGTLLYVKK